MNLNENWLSQLFDYEVLYDFFHYLTCKPYIFNILQSQRRTLDLLADVATLQEYQPVAQPDPPVQMTPFPNPSASVMPFIPLPPGNHRIIENNLFTIGDVDTVVYDPQAQSQTKGQKECQKYQCKT